MPNKSGLSPFELHPLERTPQSNQEPVDAKIHTAKKSVTAHQ